MARRSTAEVRQLLLDAAAQAFRVKGYARATTDEIAEAAGVSLSVLFRHFPAKADLLRTAVVQPFVDSLREFADAWDRSQAVPISEDAVMREVVSDLYDNLRKHDDAVIALLAAESELDDSTAKDIERLFNQVFAQLTDMGEQEAERRGWFSGEGMDLNVRLLVGMVTATIAYRRWFLPAGRNRVSRERLISHMTQLMLYGLRLQSFDGDER